MGLKKVHYRLGAIAKVLIVTTFVEDSLRVLLTFSVQQQSMRIAGWQTPALHSALPASSAPPAAQAADDGAEPGVVGPPFGGRRDQAWHISQ